MYSPACKDCTRCLRRLFLKHCRRRRVPSRPGASRDHAALTSRSKGARGLEEDTFPLGWRNPHNAGAIGKSSTPAVVTNFIHLNHTFFSCWHDPCNPGPVAMPKRLERDQDNDRDAEPTNLLRQRHDLGVCAAIARFLINPNWLRVAFCLPIYWTRCWSSAPIALSGLVVAVTLYAVPARFVEFHSTPPGRLRYRTAAVEEHANSRA